MNELVNYRYNNILRHVVKLIGHNGTTSTLELNNIGKLIFGDRFVGVYARDTIPFLHNKESCIVNMDNSFQSGSHWIAIVKYGFYHIVYDSFARTKITFNLHKVLTPQDDAEQHVKELNCGQRCIAFIQFFYTYGWANAKWL